MKKCENFSKCKQMIDEKYRFCQTCNSEYAKNNAETDKAKAINKIANILEKMNWNIGLKNEFTKRSNPELWKQIEQEWQAKKEEQEDNEL